MCKNLRDVDIIVGNPQLKKWGIVPKQFPAWQEDEKPWFEEEIEEEWIRDQIRTIDKKLTALEDKWLQECSLVDLAERLNKEFPEIFKTSLER